MANDNLTEAKRAKNDEFYTQYADIEKEMNAYLEYDPDVFKNKTVLLPCDDPEWSNFTKYFAQNFERLGLKKLISTSYAPDAKPARIEDGPTLFELDDPKFDPEKTVVNGKIYTITRDVSGDGRIAYDDLEWDYLNGDGDFRSAEVRALRDESDVIITNPPFSLFREFLSWIVEAEKKFVIVGNPNAVTYKDIFALFKRDKIWWGAKSSGGQNMFLSCLDSYADGLVATKREGTWWKRIDGKVHAGIKTVWFTNLDHGKRHQPLPLMTTADNVKFSKHKKVKGVGYAKYDNYDAIEIPFVDAIPSDYRGVMGVPITFLDKYCPEQFKIVGIVERGEDTPVSSYQIPNHKKYDRPYLNGQRIYARILIKHRSPTP